MGERLAKEADALYKAKIEQSPLWHKAMRERGLTSSEALELTIEMTSVLREVVLHIAREVEDPPRRDQPQP
jgi:hypothetical protein